MIESYMIYIWLGITVLSLVIEAFTTELISIWVAGGALVALILSAINGVPYYAEIIVFVVLSIILILFTRPMCKKYLMRNERKTNVDTIIGIKCAVSEEITPLKHGKVKIYGVEWTAISSNGTTIESVGSSATYDELGDIEYFLRQLLKYFKVPFSLSNSTP